jgi:hypothetical protein
MAAVTPDPPVREAVIAGLRDVDIHTRRFGKILDPQ